VTQIWHFYHELNISNLVVEIMQNSFIHNLYISCIDIMLWNTFDTQIYKKIWNLCDIHSFIGLYFIYQHIRMYFKHVFNTWNSYVKFMNLWMDKLLMIFIINSLHIKFMMLKLYILHYLKFLPLWLLLNYNYYNYPLWFWSKVLVKHLLGINKYVISPKLNVKVSIFKFKMD